MCTVRFETAHFRLSYLLLPKQCNHGNIELIRCEKLKLNQSDQLKLNQTKKNVYMTKMGN